jgi:predicted metal-dependent peptidase
MSATTPAARDALHALLSASDLLARYPFHAALLARVEVVRDPSIPWMAVSLDRGRYYLHANTEALAREPRWTAGLLLHELQHIALGHLANPAFREDIAHEAIMTLCLEMSANEGIAEPLPNPIVWQQFERFGVRAGQSTLERYRALTPIGRRDAALKAARESGQGPVDDHGPWREGNSAHAGALARTRDLVERALDEARREGLLPDARLAGLTPGRLLEGLGAPGPLAEGAHEIDWRARLQGFVQRLRAPTRTFSRPNRRFPTRVGEVPGRAFRGGTDHRPGVLAVIDTSASMGSAALSAIARELERLAPHARVIVCECDVEITRVQPFRGRIESVQGRGGTDLRPPFDPGLRAREGVDAIVYFTDGEGPTLERAPDCPTLWVLTHERPFACPWGERALLAVSDGAG